MTHEIQSYCSYCGKLHDRTSAVAPKGKYRREPMPEEGDITLCFDCGEWSVYDSQGQLRKPTEQERIHLRNDIIASQVHEAWERSRRR
jgi:hypothetical protein